MTDHGGQAPIVVGIDGSAPAHDALDWAAAEATAMQRPLRLVHSFLWPLTSVPLAPASIGRAHGASQAAAERVLADAEAQARSAAPDLKITSELMVGAATPSLVRQARDAELLVVGSRGHGMFAGPLMGSVSIAVAAHAPSPVVVVRPRSHDYPAPAKAGVVVGADGSEPSASAIEFAFHAAARRRVGLTAVRAWAPPLSGYRRLVVGLDGIESAELHRLLHALESSRRQFPEVDVRAKLVRDHHPGRALVVESAGADLVVVGSHGHGGVAGLLLGSVSQSVLAHATCPVAVVRRTGGGRSHAAPLREADEASRDLHDRTEMENS
jgi:nucleotide-binding universal stress UspA family protein